MDFELKPHIENRPESNGCADYTRRPIIGQNPPRIRWICVQMHLREIICMLERTSMEDARGVLMRSTACMVACAPAQASVTFWRCRLGRYHGWAEVALKRHPRNSNGDAAIIEVFSYSVASLGC